MAHKETNISVEDILFTLPQRYRPRSKAVNKGVVHFVVQGKRGGSFTVTIDGNQCRVEKGVAGEADCVVRSRDKVLIGIELGQLNPQVAFLMRRITISNLSLFLEFNKQFIPFHKWHRSQNSNESRTALPLLKGPLRNITILDFTRLYPAPLATMWLGDLGAQVIKIEHPQSPDPMRSYPPFTENGLSAGFLSVNRNKLSLALDFTVEEGRNILEALIKKADVLVESYRPGRMSDWGLDYESVKNINPRLIYITLSGFPIHGAFAHFAGHDLNFYGLSGALNATGTPEQPVIPAIQIADVLGAYNVVVTTLLALWNRQNEEQGGYYPLSLMEAMVSATQLQLAQHAFASSFVARGQGILSGGMAAYNVYSCKDNQFIALAAVEPKFWETFCDAVGHPEWKGAYFLESEEQAHIIQAVGEVIRQHPREYWEALGKKLNICLTPVLSFGEVKEWFQKNQGGVNFGEINHVPVTLPPFIGVSENNHPAPSLGEHTVPLLEKLGLSSQKISTLKHEGIIQ